jgi:hypothetical protein
MGAGTITVYLCPICRRELGRGPVAPVGQRCCGKLIVFDRNSPMVNGPADPIPLVPANSGPSIFSSTSNIGSLVMGSGMVVVGLLIAGACVVLGIQSQQTSSGRSRPRRLA